MSQERSWSWRQKDCQIRKLTGVDSHVPVPRGPVVERLAADGTLFAFFGIAHAGRGHLLHVVVQLQLKQEIQFDN